MESRFRDKMPAEDSTGYFSFTPFSNYFIQGFGMSAEEELQIMADIDKLISDTAGRPLHSSDTTLPTKNAVQIKKEIVKKYLREHLVRIIDRFIY